jgi:predicted MFS family arabinose efflux permease
VRRAGDAATAAALIDGHGWRVAFAVSGAGFGSLLALCAVAVRPPPRTPAVIVRPLTRVLRSREFVRLYASWVFATTALFVPFVFLPVFARDHGAPSVAASSLLSVLGGASLVGRLGIGVLVARIGTLASFKIAVFIMVGSYVMWLTSSSYGRLAAFSAVLACFIHERAHTRR